MRGSRAAGLAVLAASMALAACPGGGGAPPVTITLPGATCTGTVGCTVTARVTNDASARPVLTIKVCVTCNGTPLGGVGSITGTIQSEVPLPPSIPAVTTFGATGNDGCTTVRYVVTGAILQGQQVTVKVVDTTGATVTTEVVTIE